MFTPDAFVRAARVEHRGCFQRWSSRSYERRSAAAAGFNDVLKILEGDFRHVEFLSPGTCSSGRRFRY
jgi:hypothetical protein